MVSFNRESVWLFDLLLSDGLSHRMARNEQPSRLAGCSAVQTCGPVSRSFNLWKSRQAGGRTVGSACEWFSELLDSWRLDPKRLKYAAGELQDRSTTVAAAAAAPLTLYLRRCGYGHAVHCVPFDGYCINMVSWRISISGAGSLAGFAIPEPEV